jgi:hypothetical protein
MVETTGRYGKNVQTHENAAGLFDARFYRRARRGRREEWKMQSACSAMSVRLAGLRRGFAGQLLFLQMNKGIETMSRTRACAVVERDQIVHLLNRLLSEDAGRQLRTASTLAWIGIQTRKQDVAVRGCLSNAARGRVGATHFVPALKVFPALPMSVRREMAMALGDLAGGVAVDELARLTAVSDVGARLIAVDALGKIGGPQAVRSLKAAVGDVNETVRAETVRALGQLVAAERNADAPERAEVETLLLDVRAGDPSEYVREVAGEALAAIREAGLRQPGVLPDRTPSPAISVPA